MLGDVGDEQHGGDQQTVHEDVPAPLHVAFETPFQHGKVAIHPERLVLALVLLVAQQVGAHERRQGPRNHQREEDADARGDSEALEELTDYARHEARRREYGDQDRGSGDDSEANFVGGFDGGQIGFFAFADMADDVFDFDDGVVNQNTDRQGQGQQCYDVERLVEDVHYEEGRQQRHRHGHGRHEGRPAVAQEQPYDEHRQDGADQQGFHRRIEGPLDLVDRGRDLHDLDMRIIGFQFFNDGAHGSGDVVFRRSTRALDVEADGFGTVETGAGAGFRPGIRNSAEIAETDAAAVRQGDALFRQFGDAGRAADGADGLFRRARVEAAPRHVDVGRTQLSRNIGRRDALRRQLGRIELDANFTIDTAIAIDRRHAAHALDLLANIVVDVPAELVRRHVIGANDIGQKRLALRVFDARNDGILDVAGQVAAHRCHGITHVVGRFFEIGIKLESDDRRRRALIDVGLGMAHAFETGDRVFDDARDLVLQFCRRRTRADHGDDDDGEVDVRPVVDTQRAEAERTDNGHDDEENESRDRVADRPGRYLEAAAARRLGRR